ncbi:MAG: formaldehyde-activating enzyme [Actinobacteria bacterium]|nr:formaldehyde-activating enzyme [Actinomycetota bacterium]
MELGESFVGAGPEAAHVNTILGDRLGPVGTAWATALATPREGHAGLVVVAKPNLPVLPFTLFVNKATIASPLHGKLTWGAAQLGIAAGVLDALGAGSIDQSQVHELAIIAAVWVDPDAKDEDLVFENNRRSMSEALQSGATRVPRVEDLLGYVARAGFGNAYYVPKS